MAKEPRRLSVLVPVYNNVATLEPLCSRLHAALRDFDYELLFINDGSRDASLVTLKRLASSDQRLKVISLSRNFGQHPAIAAAIDHAAGDVLVLMDADLEDQPEQIPSLVGELEAHGCDIVYTTKNGRVRSSRDLTSDFYHYVFSRMVGMSLPRQLGTFRVFTRKVLNALRQFPERHILYGPLMFYVGFRFVIVPVESGTGPRASSYSFGKRFRLALNSLVTYTDLPPRLFAGLGLGMVTLPLLYAAIVIVQYLVIGRSLPRGLTVVVLLICLLAGMIMLAIGMLGVYIFRIFQEVLARPRYLIDETMNLVQNDADGCSSG